MPDTGQACRTWEQTGLQIVCVLVVRGRGGTLIPWCGLQPEYSEFTQTHGDSWGCVFLSVLALTPGLSHQKILNVQRRIPAKTIKHILLHIHTSTVESWLYWGLYCQVSSWNNLMKNETKKIFSYHLSRSNMMKQISKWDNTSPRCYLYLLEHVRVVTDLPQLHDCIHQCLRASFTLVNTIG